MKIPVTYLAGLLMIWTVGHALSQQVVDADQLHAQVLAQNMVELRWQMQSEAQGLFDIYREGAGGQARKLNAEPLRMAVSPRDGGWRYTGYYRDSGVSHGQHYRYWVTLLSRQGKPLLKSGPLEVYLHDGLKPPRVEGLSAVSDERQIRLSWQAPDDEEVSGFRLYRQIGRAYSEKPNDPEEAELIAELDRAQTSYVDKDVDTALFYHYRVRALDPYSGEGELSYPALAMLLDKVAPEPASRMSARLAEDGAVRFNWMASPSADVTQYWLYRSVEDGAAVVVQRVAVEKGKTQHAVVQLNTASPFRFRYHIVALDGSGNQSEASEPVEVRLPDRTAPAIPIVKDIKATDKGVVINWYALDDANLAGYRVYRRVAGGEVRALNDQLIQTTQYSDGNAFSGELYEYSVTALDAAGNESPRSGWRLQRSIVPQSLPTVTGLKLRVSADRQVTLRWQKVASEHISGYLVYRLDAKGGKRQVSGLLKQPVFKESLDKASARASYQVRGFYLNGRYSELSQEVVWRARK